jgi:hypothetical protein
MRSFGISIATASFPQSQKMLCRAPRAASARVHHRMVRVVFMLPAVHNADVAVLVPT